MPKIVLTCSTVPEVVYLDLYGTSSSVRFSVGSDPSDRVLTSCPSGWVSIDLDTLGGGASDLSIAEIESLMAGVILMFTVAFVFKFVRRQFSKSDT
jgi:hypothetical protein